MMEKELGHGASRATVREGGSILDQPPALRRTADREPATGAGTDVWESDLTDLTGLPLTALDELAPLHPPVRVLEEVLRARGGIRGGNEGSARAE